MNKVGFMQGRLSPILDNKIQAFPFDHWEQEFSIAKELGIKCMEWTLDYPNLRINPLLLNNKKEKILSLSFENEIALPSVTLDCCMQRPFWKEQNKLYFQDLVNDFELIIQSAKKIGAKILVIPLVDNGAITNISQFKLLKNTIQSLYEKLEICNMRIAFESDYPPSTLLEFIEEFDKEFVGINYDTGNSASLGYDVNEEFKKYGNRIINIHIKDRILNGTTVRLGHGDTNFTDVFKQLSQIDFNGNYILQTARSKEGKHFEELENNLLFLNSYF